MSAEHALWKAVLTRDATQDGKFVYGVMTTGVYCRPSCAARRPLRRNVRFFSTPAEAEQAGLRPCRRCKPNGIQNSQPIIESVVQELARQIDAHPEQPLRLADLARRAGYSPYHFQRSFKAVLGSTPKEYQTAARLRKFKQDLRGETPVSDAIYRAGFGSASRLYEKVDTQLGMTPGEYRSGGRGISIGYATAHTVLGLMMIGATDRGICFLAFGESEQELAEQLAKQFPNATRQPMPPTHKEQFDAWIQALNRHLRGIEPRLDLPLDVRGTAFQLIVWRYLQKIPYGEVQSYTEVAQAIGKPKAVRAVASACARNNIAIAIPCHRVVRGTGALGGYRWGLQRKRVLLDSERAAAARRKA
ncbi:MAG TPA: bifunctional DNA-binding transcriptional regulator/O6-methylguanine-DNA methyltransferase Ada [Steroidobacteraceae bacterium]